VVAPPDARRERLMEVINVASVPIHVVDCQAVIEHIDSFIREGTPHYNVAINASKVVDYQTDPELRAAIEGAHLLTADGQSIVWAARLLGHPLPGRIAGADLMIRLLGHAAERGYSVFFLGARPEVVTACAAKAIAEFPTLRVAGARDGYFTASDEPNVVNAIRDSAPDILFLGFGSPTKELFMQRRYRELGVPFVMGVGGTFDVYIGIVRRAPVWMQRAGLEWLYRVGQEPRRMWKRYLVGNSKFIALVTRDFVERRLRRHSDGS
jgi:N-acetylglucosaminyldiphosphoundecaprenol N-acetyl-beta-D-mannosaminyltransferase